MPTLGWMPAWLLRRFFDGADRWVLDPRVAPAVNTLRDELGLSEPVQGVMKQYWHSPDGVIGGLDRVE